jgi:hypothetical protein
MQTRPRGFTENEMNKVGVTITDAYRIRLQCKSCGCAWSPNLQSEGKLPKGYWRCPNGCNKD